MPNTPAATTILVVDDHRKIREPLATYLRRQHFSVITAEDAASLWSMLRTHAFDLIVLDVMLPDGDGMQLCQQIHRRFHTPVILLTARDALDDRVAGLELGADDYVVKPFEPRELLARIHTVLRRAERQPIAQPPPVAVQPLVFADLTFNPASRLVHNPQQHSVRLSTMESKLLLALLNHPYQVLSREALMDRCVTPGNEIFDRAVDRQVSRLRIKLEQVSPGSTLLDTVWGEGYRFTAEVQLASACAE